MPVEIGTGAHIDSLIGGDEGQEICSATPEDNFFGEYTVISFQILMKRMDKSAIYGDTLPSTTAICRQQCHVSGKKLPWQYMESPVTLNYTLVPLYQIYAIT